MGMSLHLRHSLSAIMSKPSQPYLRDLQFRGIVEGLTYLDDKSRPQCHFFGGIPYGLPPVGPFRFQKPRSLPTCYRYGTKSNPGSFTGSCGLCPQITRQGLDDHLWKEDCLQSNIWVPTGEPPNGGLYGNSIQIISKLILSRMACIVLHTWWLPPVRQPQ
jgi:hypothetical protein